MMTDDRPVAREDLSVLLAQIQDRLAQSDKENRALWQGVIDQFTRLNGQVTSTAIKVGGHETAIALSHERIESVARRTHDHANFFTSFQKEQQQAMLLQERILARLEHTEQKSIEASAQAHAAEMAMLEKTEHVEALIAERAEKLSQSIDNLKQESRFDLRTMILVVVAAIGLTWGTFMTLAKP